jgi:hypothetical protein
LHWLLCLRRQCSVGLHWQACKKVLHPIRAMEFLTAQEWTTHLMEIPMQILLALHPTQVMESLTARDIKFPLFGLLAISCRFYGPI